VLPFPWTFSNEYLVVWVSITLMLLALFTSSN